MTQEPASFKQRLEIVIQDNLSHIGVLKLRIQELRKLQKS